MNYCGNENEGFYIHNKPILESINRIDSILGEDYEILGGMAIQAWISKSVYDKVIAHNPGIKLKMFQGSLEKVLRKTKDIDLFYPNGIIELIDAIDDYYGLVSPKPFIYDDKKSELSFNDLKGCHISIWTPESFSRNQEHSKQFYLNSLDRSKKIKLYDVEMNLLSPEDIIVSKLEPFRDKDQKDILLLNTHLNKSAYNIDFDKIKEIINCSFPASKNSLLDNFSLLLP